MTASTFETLKADIMNIVGLGEKDIHILKQAGEQLLNILNAVISSDEKRLLENLQVENPGQMLALIKDFLRVILTGKQDFQTIRKLALQSLRTGTSIYRFALIVSTVLDGMKPLISERFEDPEDIVETLKKFSLVMLLLLADEINQAFLQAVREATGMSQALLENYMKSVINSMIKSEGA